VEIRGLYHRKIPGREWNSAKIAGNLDVGCHWFLKKWVPQMNRVSKLRDVQERLRSNRWKL
jgi:hypothetical protein